MNALEFALFLRDESTLHLTSTEGDKKGKPSGGELRRWLEKGCIRCNGTILSKGDTVTFPVMDLVLFPKNEHKRTTIF